MNSNYNFVINKNNLKYNIENLKTNFSNYSDIFIDLSNNAFNHGLAIVCDYYKWGINNYFLDNLTEAIKVRSFNRHIDIWCGEKIDLDYVYDAINNDIVVRIYSLDYLESIQSLNLKDDLKIELLISTSKKFPGLKSIKDLKEALKIVEQEKHLILKGITTTLDESKIESLDFEDQTNEFSKYAKLVDNEKVKVILDEKCTFYKKRNYVNSVVLKTLQYGLVVNDSRNFLQKLKDKQEIKKYNLESKLNEVNYKLKPAFLIESYVLEKFKVEKKESFLNYKFKEDCEIGIVPIGKKIGLDDAIEYVLINEEKCPVLKIEYDYMYIILNNGNHICEIVHLLGDNLLDSINGDSRVFMLKFNNNCKIKYIE